MHAVLAKLQRAAVRAAEWGAILMRWAT